MSDQADVMASLVTFKSHEITTWNCHKESVMFKRHHSAFSCTQIPVIPEENNAIKPHNIWHFI